ncbi:hypothetical protein DP73_07085 [Desulfosporosinus sp. HMP52]|nr:hypothetical protein DP73_07085 [Desulfosporosinus sp. HMP52]
MIKVFYPVNTNFEFKNILCGIFILLETAINLYFKYKFLAKLGVKLEFDSGTIMAWVLNYMILKKQIV